MGRVMVWALAALLAVAPASLAQAQDDDDETEEEAESDDEAADGEDGDENGEDGDEDSEDGDEDGEDGDEAAEGGDSEEDVAESGSDAAAARQWFFGPYFRYVFVPAFMLELFLDAAPTVANAAFGVAATYRTDDGPMFEVGIGYTGYGFEDPFRAKGDPTTDTEYVESDLGLVHLTGSILWQQSLVEEKLFFEYGIGVDIGVVTGDMVRTEAYYSAASDQYLPCTGPGMPVMPLGYCTLPSVSYDQEGEHYNVVEERVPPVALLPMLPRLGLRYEPIPELAVKFEAAYGIAQIWLGLSAAYAPKL